jgi:glutamate-5-semialdehyde dehydrogenase
MRPDTRCSPIDVWHWPSREAQAPRWPNSVLSPPSRAHRSACTAPAAHGWWPGWLRRVLRHSLDRKVCNTANVVVVLRERADELVPVVLDALDEAAASRGSHSRLHVVAGSEPFVDASRFERTVPITRAAGTSDEPAASLLAEGALDVEWE